MKQYTVEFKIKVVEEYMKGSTALNLASKYNIPYSSKHKTCSTLNNWIKAYKEGRLSLGNAVRVSRKSILVDGVRYIPYVKPKDIININGIDYIKDIYV